MSHYFCWPLLLLVACDAAVDHASATCPDVVVNPPEVVVQPTPVVVQPAAPVASLPEPWQTGFSLPYDPPADPPTPGVDTIGGVPVIPVRCDFIYVVEAFAGGPEVAFCGWLLPESYQMCLVGYGGLTVTCIPYGFPRPL